jgi:uncharacterized protein (UPF0276 family)
VPRARPHLPDLGFGLGLRHCHFQHLLAHRHVLGKLRRELPIVMHGVSLSIGSTDPLDLEYLKKLRELAAWLEPAWISDHLCWTGSAGYNTHDLMPLPLSEEALVHVSERVLRVQDFLRRPLVLENPSSYVEFAASALPEWEFLGALVERTDAAILLDVNNVFVGSYNHGFDPEHYVRSLPHRRIVQIHLAGPTSYGDYLVDTHDHPVPTRVYELFRLAMALTGGVSTLLEWDAAIPPYPELVRELERARRALTGELPDVPLSGPIADAAEVNPFPGGALRELAG